METEINFLAENAAGETMLLNQQPDFNMQSFNHPEPEDGEEDDKDDEDNGDAAGNDDPPLDEEVVHSPVTTQDGGKPKK